MNQYKQKILEFADNIFQFGDITTGREAIGAKIKDFPVVCELCSGSGNHIVAQAKRAKAAANDDRKIFIGFELRFKRIYRTIEKAKANGVGERVFVAGCQAELINYLFDERRLDGVYINFPDPWEKKRLRKHRLLTAEFLAALSTRIKPGGFFSFKTDHGEYFSSVLDQLRANDNFTIVHETTDLYNSPCLADNIPTEFEGMFLRDQCKICHVLAQVM